ncbi:MAG: aminotransferase class IV [Bacteroidota bacterium]
MQQYNPKNADIKVYVGGEILPRKEAKVSVFDSVVQGGDAVWEGLRVYDGRIFCLDRHLYRLQASARAMAFTNVPSDEEIKKAIFATLEANGMRDDTHIRLTLTRGEKVTSGMDPQLNQFGPTLIVLAEWKPPIYAGQRQKLVTASVRRNSPQMVDSKIHHNNLINNILAKIEANVAGKDAALMLDIDGFVAEANGTSSIRQELDGYDACFFCLGISAASVSKEVYYRITHDLTIHWAETLVALNPDMTFIYVSGEGTDSKESSRSNWANVKGKTENEILEMPFKQKYMFRPGYIQPQRGIRSATPLYNAMYVIFKPLYPIMKAIFGKAITSTTELGQAMIKAHRLGSEKAHLHTPDINELAAS